MSGRATGDGGRVTPVRPGPSGDLRVPRRRPAPGFDAPLVGGILLAALLAVTACRGGGETPGSSPGGQPATAEERRGVTSVEDGASRENAARRDPRRDTAEDDDRPLRRYRLRLVNRSSGSVHFLAGAGRGEVVLDTVASADSGDVWVETRAVRLFLRAALEGERTIRTDTLDLREGELTRWSAGGR